MHKWRVGDKVRIKNSCSGAISGEVYILGIPPGKHRLFAWNKNRNEGCSCQDNWILVEAAIKEIKLYGIAKFLQEIEK